MNTLFISTYNEFVIVGLLKDGKEISLIKKESFHGHSEYLVPTIKETLDLNKMSVHDINEILVVSGPGSFTGVRLGITVAKTLAYTLNIPIKTITSIEAIAASINKPNLIVTINDSKGKYLGRFENNKLDLLVYLKEEEAIKYLDSVNIPVINSQEYNLELIYQYSQNLPYTNAHAVKATYIKEIEALNGK